MILRKAFILILFIAGFNYLSAQNIQNKNFTLISYNLDISDDLTKELASMESFVSGIKTYNDPGNDKLRAIFEHITYYTLSEKLKERLEIQILPVNTFMREVKYDDYGYPKTTIREAQRKGDSKFYFKVNAKLESITKKTKNENPELFENYDESAILPQWSIEITVWNKQGIIPVDKWLGSTTAKKPLLVNEYLFKGFDNSIMDIDYKKEQADNLFIMLDRAIHNTIQDFYNKDE